MSEHRILTELHCASHYLVGAAVVASCHGKRNVPLLKLRQVDYFVVLNRTKMTLLHIFLHCTISSNPHPTTPLQEYDKLFQKHKVDTLDLKTNVLAAYVAAHLASEIPDLMSAMKLSPKQSFEVGYNKACGLVDTGDFAAAEAELRMATKLGE